VGTPSLIGTTTKQKEEREVVGVVVHPMEIEELEPKRLDIVFLNIFL